MKILSAVLILTLGWIGPAFAQQRPVPSPAPTAPIPEPVAPSDVFEVNAHPRDFCCFRRFLFADLAIRDLRRSPSERFPITLFVVADARRPDSAPFGGPTGLNFAVMQPAFADKIAEAKGSFPDATVTLAVEVSEMQLGSDATRTLFMGIIYRAVFVDPNGKVLVEVK